MSIQRVVYDLSRLQIGDEVNKEAEIGPVVYRNTEIDKLEVLELEGEPDNKERIIRVLEKFRLSNCYQRLTKPVNKEDGDGFIYVYCCEKYPGCFKVGRSKMMPARRIRNQEKSNLEAYITKRGFFCTLHKLVEKCVHLELEKMSVVMDRNHDGYTEWFAGDWRDIEEVIENVISAVKKLKFRGLLVGS